MHITRGLALVRREPVQSDIPAPRVWATPDFAGFRAWEQADATRVRVRKLLPGAILLTVLALIGALFPIVF